MYFHMCCILQKEFILHLLPSYFIQITLHMKYIDMGNECVTFVCARLQFQHNNQNILFLRENNKPAVWKYSITITRKLVSDLLIQKDFAHQKELLINMHFILLNRELKNPFSNLLPRNIFFFSFKKLRQF